MADAYVLKSYGASGVYEPTDLECIGPVPIPACGIQPFSARLDYLDGAPDADNQLGASSVTYFKFLAASSAFSFQYQSFDPQPSPGPRPAFLISALIQEQDDAIRVTANFMRSVNPPDTPTWSFGPDGGFSMTTGHGEGGFGAAGALQWQLLRTVQIPEPSSFLLFGIALAGLYRQRLTRAVSMRPKASALFIQIP